jgi:aspartyl/asparaginyl beta-hydroxylase (cupin superfamily)
MQVLEKGTTQLQPWYYADGQPYPMNDPAYFDPKDYPWVAQLESQWEVIRDELEALLQANGDSLVPYFNPNLVSSPNAWKTYALFFWKLKFWNNCRKCPTTTKILESIPYMVGASFSMLEPNSAVTPHNGDTNAIARCHMGLAIPAGLPECGFQVNGEKRAWENGKLMLFCDAHVHTAFNNTDQRRFVLILDVMRPEYASQTNAVCWRVWRAILKQMWDTQVVAKFKK